MKLSPEVWKEAFELISALFGAGALVPAIWRRLRTRRSAASRITPTSSITASPPQQKITAVAEALTAGSSGPLEPNSGVGPEQSGSNSQPHLEAAKKGEGEKPVQLILGAIAAFAALVAVIQKPAEDTRNSKRIAGGVFEQVDKIEARIDFRPIETTRSGRGIAQILRQPWSASSAQRVIDLVTPPTKSDSIWSQLPDLTLTSRNSEDGEIKRTEFRDIFRSGKLHWEDGSTFSWRGDFALANSETRAESTFDWNLLTMAARGKEDGSLQLLICRKNGVGVVSVVLVGRNPTGNHTGPLPCSPSASARVADGTRYTLMSNEQPKS